MSAFTPRPRPHILRPADVNLDELLAEPVVNLNQRHTEEQLAQLQKYPDAKHVANKSGSPNGDCGSKERGAEHLDEPLSHHAAASAGSKER